MEVRMGEHRRDFVKKIIVFTRLLGEALGYFVTEEELMFPGSRNSPILDMAWRRNEAEKYPLFIFEFESFPTKSASDNALKVFSRKTDAYQKPLFFFHIFVEQKMNTDRIQSFREHYDRLNYGAYALSDESSHLTLMHDILDL